MGGSGGAGGSTQPPPVVLVSGSQTQTLAVGSTPAMAIAVDSASVYWTVHAAHFVMKVPKGGGGTPAVVYDAGPIPSGDYRDWDAIFVDDTSVYFSQTGQASSSVMVQKVPKDGSAASGSAITLLSRGGAGFGPDYAIDSKNFYLFFQNKIVSVPLGGGPEVTVVDPTSPGPIDPSLGRAIMPGYPIGLVSDGTTVYYTASEGTMGWLLSVPAVGGTPVILATALKLDTSGNTYVDSGRSRPCVKAGYVTWGNTASHYVYKEAIRGGMPTVLALDFDGANNGDAVSDGTNVYYIGSQGLMKVPLAGGSPVVVANKDATGDASASNFPMVVDDTGVYMITSRGIVSFAK